MARRAKRRPPVKQDEILSALRAGIVGGRLKPGDQLPTHLQIARKFKTTGVTAQRAYERLTEQGFVTVRGRQGTFVADRPPHLHRFVLAFPQDRSKPWVRFWTVLESSARALTDAGTHWIDVRIAVDSKKANGDYQRLVEDVQAGNLAGILFATNPFLVEGTPLLETPGLPRLALMSPPGPPGVTAIAFGHASFLERAVDHLVSRGRKRIAFLMVPGFTVGLPWDLEHLLISRGLPYHPLRIQMSHQSLGEWTGHLTHLLVSAPPDERPDGLVIVDDNLVEHACGGLLKAGLRLPEDIDVVAHCNFPAPTASALPVARLGYDIPRILEFALDVMSRQRKGEPTPDGLNIAPEFEWEVVSGKSAPARIA
jgi:DNA-binding LacI/PurR family transcriptional regulator